jgi:hypothetical protein
MINASKAYLKDGESINKDAEQTSEYFFSKGTIKFSL